MYKNWLTTTNPYHDIKKEIFDRMDDHNRTVEEYLRYDVLSTMKTALAVCDVKNMIEDVIFNPPATIILWKDGTKTVVKEQDGYEFNPWVGMAMACSKKMLGNKGNYFEVFKKYCEPYEEKSEPSAVEFLANLVNALRYGNAEAGKKITTALGALSIPELKINIEGFEKKEEEEVMSLEEYKATQRAMNGALNKSRYNPVEEAYMQINNFLNGNGSLDLDEIRGLLGEALE